MSSLHDIPKGYETKMNIISAMIELGKNETIDEMTVSDICARADITRQTFYHHFVDKYDAVQWYNLQLCSDLLGVIGNGLTWYESGLRMLVKTLDEQDFYHFTLSSSEDPNSLFSILSNTFYESWKKTLIELPDFQYTDRIDYQLQAWSKLGYTLVSDWREDGFRIPVEIANELMISCMPYELRTATDNYVLCKRKSESEKYSN